MTTLNNVSTGPSLGHVFHGIYNISALPNGQDCFCLLTYSANKNGITFFSHTTRFLSLML